VKNTKDFFSLYLEYTADTECPTFFHRWAGITCLSASLGRELYLKNGHFKLYPNLYTLLIGVSGTRKSTAIKMSERLLKLAGYNTFAAKKTRQEKFLLDLSESGARAGVESYDSSSFLDDDFLGEEEDLGAGGKDIEYLEATKRPPAEIFICADEFNDFIGTGNLDFMSILGSLWDYEGVFDYKLKNSKSVYINEPAVTMIGGITPTQLNITFPAEAIGQGFFSRLIVIHAESSKIRHTWMPDPNEKLERELIEILRSRRKELKGEVVLSEGAKEILDTIYQTWEPLTDPRFEAYSSRRFPQLLKLSLVVAASKGKNVVDAGDAIEANTILTYTESKMEKALGEFGRSKNSEIVHKIMQFLDKVDKPATFKDIWIHVCADLDRRDYLKEILMNLLVAEKIQVVDDIGYLVNKKIVKEKDSKLFSWDVLTSQERGLL